jgi:hypothetical protein
VSSELPEGQDGVRLAQQLDRRIVRKGSADADVELRAGEQLPTHERCRQQRTAAIAEALQVSTRIRLHRTAAGKDYRTAEGPPLAEQVGQVG